MPSTKCVDIKSILPGIAPGKVCSVLFVLAVLGLGTGCRFGGGGSSSSSSDTSTVTGVATPNSVSVVSATNAN